MDNYSYRYNAHSQARWTGLGGALFSSLCAFTGIFLFLAFLALGIACSILYLAELAEEHTQFTRKIINIIIKVVTALYVMLYLVDGLPFFCVLFGIVAHVLYYNLIMKTYPFVHLTSLEFSGSAGAGLLSCIMWLRFLWYDPRCAYVTFEWALGFMIVMVFMVPFLFLISLTTTSQALPFVTHGEGRKRTTAISSLFRFVINRRDQVLPTSTRHQT